MEVICIWFRSQESRRRCGESETAVGINYVWAYRFSLSISPRSDGSWESAGAIVMQLITALKLTWIYDAQRDFSRLLFNSDSR